PRSSCGLSLPPLPDSVARPPLPDAVENQTDAGSLPPPSLFSKQEVGQPPTRPYPRPPCPPAVRQPPRGGGHLERRLRACCRVRANHFTPTRVGTTRARASSSTATTVHPHA